MKTTLKIAENWLEEYYLQGLHKTVALWLEVEGKNEAEKICKELEAEIIRAHNLRAVDPFWFDDDDNEINRKEAESCLAKITYLLATTY